MSAMITILSDHDCDNFSLSLCYAPTNSSLSNCLFSEKRSPAEVRCKAALADK
jgi:hypothetical protein